MSIAARKPALLSYRTHRSVAAGVPLLLMVLIAGCNQKPGPDVVATVNGHAIVRADLDRMYKAQLGQNPGQTPSSEQADSLRLNIVRELIDEEIVEQRAAKMNLTPTAEDVDAKLNEMKAPYTEDQ
ncbi:MAG TPA: SurA N-terminal domain-containing protein, partial [Acidobacteriaceae bacterium]